MAAEEDRLIWIGDAISDPRFCDRPNVKGPAHVRFYAAAPPHLEEGTIPGVLAVAGTTARAFDQKFADHLQDLADFVADEWGRFQARMAREAALRESHVAQQIVSQIIQTAPTTLLMTDRRMGVLAISPR